MDQDQLSHQTYRAILYDAHQLQMLLPDISLSANRQLPMMHEERFPVCHLLLGISEKPADTFQDHANIPRCEIYRRNWVNMQKKLLILLSLSNVMKAHAIHFPVYLLLYVHSISY